MQRADYIKEELTDLSNAFKVAQAEGSKLPEIGHFVFRGPPGTGKTTLAATMAKVLYKLGILATNQFKKITGKKKPLSKNIRYA